jgi:hypothetical protein
VKSDSKKLLPESSGPVKPAKEVLEDPANRQPDHAAQGVGDREVQKTNEVKK